MNLNKRILAAGIMGTVLIASLTGCGSSKDITFEEGKEKTELTFSWWGPDDRNEYTIAAVKEFEKQHPDIKVNLEYSEFTGFKEKTDIKMRAHTEADVMQLNYSWVSGYSPDGTGFYDLNSVSDILNLDNYDETVLSYGMVGDSLNALPIAQNGQVFIYNKNIYDKYGLELPGSWEELFNAAQVMSQDGIYPLDMGSVAMWFTCVAYEEQASGKAIITEDGQFNFTEKELGEMISFYVDLVDKGVVEEISQRTDNRLSEGTYAGTIQWINSAEKFGGYIEESGGTSVVGKTPVLSGASRTGLYVRPATMYAVSANTTHPKEAAELLEFLVSSEEMAMGQLLDKGIPFNKKGKDILEKNNELAGLMNDAANEVEANETYLMNPKFEDSILSDTFKSACVSVLYHEATVEEAAANAYNLMKEDF